MKVAINALLLSDRPSGIGRYILRLLQHLRPAPEMEMVAYVPHGVRSSRLNSAVPFREVPVPPDSSVKRILWEQTGLPRHLRRNGTLLLHGTAFALPLAWRGPSIVTVYDLAFLRHPETFHRSNRLYLRAATVWSTRRARRVIAISSFTARELHELLRVPEEKIAVIYSGVDDRFAPAPVEAQRAARAKYGLDRPYFISVGTLEPRKNLVTLIEAYACLLQTRHDVPDLILAGKPGWLFAPIFARIRTLGLESRVRTTGYVHEADLPALYSGAVALVYPSVYEGFGLPPLEAMACGTPVLASNTTSLPEVVGDAGLLITPNDVAAWTHGLEELMQDRELTRRLRARGLARATRFRWESTAAETAVLYRTVLNEA